MMTTILGMRNRVRGLSAFVVTAVVAAATSAQAAPVNLQRVTATAGIIVNRDSGEVVWERNADLPLPPASTTKVLTTLIALESARLNDTVRVSRAAAAAAPTKLYLRAGWGLRVEDLVYALMLKSANDAAEVVAEGLSGSVEAFGRRMTSKARELGAHNSVFRNPHGLPSQGHVSTARDLTKIFDAAMSNRRFREIALTKATVIQPVTGSRKRIALRSHNRLLDSYDVPVIGKTGYTIAAKRCFVGAALGGYGSEYLVAVLGSRDLWGDLTKLLDYAYAVERGPDLDVQVARGQIPDDTVPPRLRGTSARKSAPKPASKPKRAQNTAKAKAPAKADTNSRITLHNDDGSREAVSLGDVDDEARSGRPLRPGYVVQLATLTSAARAEQLRAAAGRKGYPATVHVIGSPKKPQYRVRVGGFASRKAAERARARLKTAGPKINPIIISSGG